MNQSILLRIRRAITEDRYEFTDHLLDEAQADHLTTDDVLHVLLTGALDSTYSHDSRDVRYVVRGFIDTLDVDVVCKFKRDGSVLIIITVYVVD